MRNLPEPAASPAPATPRHATPRPATPGPNPPEVVLTIAGFDPSSGAGITADLQVFAAHGLYGTACITSVTVQSTQAVRATQTASSLIGATLRELEADLPPAGVKIGMLGDAQAVAATVAYLRTLRPHCRHVVLDPVLVSSSGQPLLTPDGVAMLRADLLPLVDWITPNVSELRALVDPAAANLGSEEQLAALHARHPHLHIVVTGGDSAGPGDSVRDTLLTPDGQQTHFDAERVDTTSTHGTGCAFTSALLARLTLGDPPAAAVAAAKAYVREALLQAPGLGRGRGPLGLLWPLRRSL